MIQRLIPKNTIRFLGIQYDGDNHQEILEFCRWCHYQPNSETLIICIHGACAEVEINDWVVNTLDDEFIIMTDREVKALFKPNCSR